MHTEQGRTTKRLSLSGYATKRRGGNRPACVAEVPAASTAALKRVTLKRLPLRDTELEVRELKLREAERRIQEVELRNRNLESCLQRSVLDAKA